MRVCVVGAGAMGSLCGAMFIDAGNEVAFLEANPATIEAISTNGLQLTRPDGEMKVYAVAISDDATTLGDPMDLVLFQVKGFATAQAAEDARPLVGPDTSVLTLQNGLGNAHVLESAFPANPVLTGVSLHSATTVAPGRYVHTGVRSTAIGPARAAWFTNAAQAVTALEGSGHPVDLEDEIGIRQVMMAKWVLNCGSLPVLAMTGLPTAQLSRHDAALGLSAALTREACVIAALEGTTLDPDERVAFNRDLFRTAGGKASMLQDLEAGRRTEIDTINGAAVRLADQHGTSVPLNAAMVALVRAREAALGITS